MNLSDAKILAFEMACHSALANQCQLRDTVGTRSNPHVPVCAILSMPVKNNEKFSYVSLCTYFQSSGPVGTTCINLKHQQYRFCDSKDFCNKYIVCNDGVVVFLAVRSAAFSFLLMIFHYFFNSD